MLKVTECGGVFRERLQKILCCELFYCPTCKSMLENFPV